MSKELPIIQKTYDLIKWYIPILNRLPRYLGLVLVKRYEHVAKAIAEIGTETTNWLRYLKKNENTRKPLEQSH